MVTLFRHIAEEVRHHLAAIGARSIEEVIGRGDLLVAKHPDHPLSAEFLAKLARAEVDRRTHGTSRSFRTVARSPVGEQIALEGRRVINTRGALELAYPIRNTDRAVGTRLSGEIAEEMGDEGLPEGSIRIRLSGVAGQSLGAFLARGIEMTLVGAANDYVGKGMGGGSIAIIPKVSDPDAVPHGAGNACLYGATAGRLFVAGSVGQRFAVRNSGASAVVEGASDHCCEYMTGGTIAVLGPVGRNVAAGMTGGTAYLWDPDLTSKAHIAASAPEPRRLAGDEAEELRRLLEDHVAATGSARARDLLARWEEAVGEFWALVAEPPPVPSVQPGIEVAAG